MKKFKQFIVEDNNIGFTTQQLSQLKNEWGKLKKIDPISPSYKKLISLLDSLPQNALSQLVSANIPFISPLAKNRIKKDVKESEIKPPTNVDKLKDRQNREKEQLKIKQDRELERARLQDFQKKETDRKLKDKQKQLEKQTKKQEDVQPPIEDDESKIFEYLEDGTLELVQAYKKSLQSS